MNSYQLISKLKKIRNDTYLTTADQALYHELVSLCNDKGWKDVFNAKNLDLCSCLNVTEKTLIKSRTVLLDAGLIHFKSCKDKRVGCYYSFSTVLSTGNIPDETKKTTGNIPVDNTVESNHSGAEIKILSPVLSTVLLTGIFPVDKNRTTVLCAGIFPVDSHFSPYKRIKTINKRESLALTHEPPPPQKPKTSRKKEGDEKPLVYPFTSIAFMATWEELRKTPKWKKKLNYSLQLSLNKLGRFEEAFAIEQMERAIESGWTGVVFDDTADKYQKWLKNGNKKQTDNDAIPDIIIRSTTG